MFLRKTKAREPLPITMTGVRMGERLLQIGVDDAALAGAIAAKVGLSGSAAMAVGDEPAAARATAAAAKAGVLVEVTVTAFDRLPYPDAAFDVVVLHGLKQAVGTSSGVTADALRQCQRILRPGGRLVAITPGPRSGLGRLWRGSPEPVGEAPVEALSAAGFRPVRVVGELEGLRFTEGVKGVTGAGDTGGL